MQRLEPVLLQNRPDAVVVVGDVNSTMAAAIVAVKLRIPVAHVEAGLRSFERSMPQEINRIVTDTLSDLLFVTEPAPAANLRNEGIPAEKIQFVGNVMIDTLLANIGRARQSRIVERLGIKAAKFALLTLHRPSNVDDLHKLRRILQAVERIAEQTPVVFPVHPRTARAVAALQETAARTYRGIRMIERLGYLDFICLLSRVAVALTDSGGVQQETTVLGVPCLTLRENTERPITVEKGTNRLVGCTPERIIEAHREAVESPPTGQIPDMWDGKAAVRIAHIIRSWHSEQKR